MPKMHSTELFFNPKDFAEVARYVVANLMISFDSLTLNRADGRLTIGNSSPGGGEYVKEILSKAEVDFYEEKVAKQPKVKVQTYELHCRAVEQLHHVVDQVFRNALLNEIQNLEGCDIKFSGRTNGKHGLTLTFNDHNAKRRFEKNLPEPYRKSEEVEITFGSETGCPPSSETEKPVAVAS